MRPTRLREVLTLLNKAGLEMLRLIKPYEGVKRPLSEAQRASFIEYRNTVEKIEKIIEEIEAELEPRHSGECDVDPETMTWKKSVSSGGLIRICMSCRERVFR